MIDDRLEEQLLKRLARIEGQVKGIARMVKERRYCIDIVTQVHAVEAALHRTSEMMLRNHLETCVAQAFRSGKPVDRREKMDELLSIYGKFRAR